MKIDDILEQLSHKNKQQKIIYPDIDDQRVFDAVKKLIASWDTPVICWKVKQLERYKEFIDTGLGYYTVPEDQENEVFAAKLLSQGEVDGFVAGNISTSGAVVKALIKNVSTQENISRISSHFLFWKGDDVFLYSDWGIQIDPSVEQLAEIAYLTIQSAFRYGIEPRVAMLSFSTAWSWWNHEKVLKVREATQILKKRLSDEGITNIPVEWEIQFDAALIPEIWQRKNPNTQLKKPANVFIFPDLNSANIAYKITERLGNALAIGPLIQWLNRPGNDLSRGCSVEDIIAAHHITKNQ